MICKDMKKLFSEIPCIKGERLTLRALTLDDAEGLNRLTQDEEVYRYLPTFLYEKKFNDAEYVIRYLYDECIKDSMILGIYTEDEFCGLAEIYGYRAPLLKASVGYRLIKSCWGKGIATETLGLLVKYLLEETDVEIITASTMCENQASANVLKKNGFKHVGRTIFENWGYPKPILTDKWLRTGAGYRMQYRFHD